jgi:hypothetical protein
LRKEVREQALSNIISETQAAQIKHILSNSTQISYGNNYPVSDCCLTPTQQFYLQLYDGEKKLISNDVLTIRKAMQNQSEMFNILY